MTPATRHSTILAAALCAVLLSACQHPQDSATMYPAAAVQEQGVKKRADIVHVGDLLDVVVMEDHSLSGQFGVLESGNIIMPSIGRIYLAGSTLEAAQNIVRRHIETDQVKKATVIVERVRTSEQASLAEMPKMLVFMSGAVARPGQHRVPLQSNDGLTAFEALMIAGGPTMYADQRHAYILRKNGRGDRVRIAVNLQAITRGELRDVQLQEGDVIVVPQRRFGL